MNANHFLTWIDRTASCLRKELGNIHAVFSFLDFINVGKNTKIALVLDNATWHNRLTEDTIPPKRAWRKEVIIQWLSRHKIKVPIKATKAELLELASKNLPEKRYVVDEIANKYNVGILRSVYVF